jgi:hypothetical protein
MLAMAVVLLAQVMFPVKDRPHSAPVPNVRCIKDSFGNYTCTDGSRVIRDSFGNVTVIPGRR